MAHTKYTQAKAKFVHRMMQEHYEPGNQSKSQIQVLRNHISKVLPMSERTLRRYMKMNPNDFEETQEL